MPATIFAMPDSPDPTATVQGHGWVDGASAWLGDWAATIPGWIWATALGLLTVFTIVSLPLARRLAYKAGSRVAGQATAEDRKDRRLLIAALTPAVLFWLAVLVGSGRSLIQFGRTDLGWHDGWDWLVPFTLDGVAVAFGALAFRAVAKERNPDRAYRVVWMATCTSAVINYFHEVGGSTLGAGYLAVLSIFGMLIFHELLAQFEEGAAWIKRTNPKFGLRWLTWPSNTLCAWVAWRNYPPVDGTDATIAVAVHHLERVRETKTTRRASEIDSPVWWMRFAPWAHVGALRVALLEQRSRQSVERSQSEALAADIRRLMAEHDDTVRQILDAHRSEVEQLHAETEQVRSDAAEQLRVERAEHAAHVSRIREKTTTAPASAPARSSAKTAPAVPAPESRLTNDEAVELMLHTHPERDYEWGQREVNKLTGAGFSRIPKLIAAVREHHDQSSRAADRSTPDNDTKEHAS